MTWPVGSRQHCQLLSARQVCTQSSGPRRQDCWYMFAPRAFGRTCQCRADHNLCQTLRRRAPALWGTWGNRGGTVQEEEALRLRIQTIWVSLMVMKMADFQSGSYSSRHAVHGNGSQRSLLKSRVQIFGKLSCCTHATSCNHSADRGRRLTWPKTCRSHHAISFHMRKGDLASPCAATLLH